MAATVYAMIAAVDLDPHLQEHQDGDDDAADGEEGAIPGESGHDLILVGQAT